MKMRSQVWFYLMGIISGVALSVVAISMTVVIWAASR